MITPRFHNNPTCLILPDDGGFEFLESSSSPFCFGCHHRIPSNPASTSSSSSTDGSKRCPHCEIAIYCSPECFNRTHVVHERTCRSLGQLQKKVIILEELLFLENDVYDNERDQDIADNFDDNNNNNNNNNDNIFYRHLQQYCKSKYCQEEEEQWQNENHNDDDEGGTDGMCTTLTWQYYSQRWKLAVLYLKLALQSHSKKFQQMAICHAVLFSQCERIRINIPMFLIDLQCDDYAFNFIQYWIPLRYGRRLNQEEAQDATPTHDSNEREPNRTTLTQHHPRPHDRETPNVHVEIRDSAFMLSSTNEEVLHNIVQSSPYLCGCDASGDTKLSRFDDVTPLLDQMAGALNFDQYHDRHDNDDDDNNDEYTVIHRSMVLHFAYALLVIKVRVVVELKSQTKSVLCLFATCPTVADWLHPVRSTIEEFVAGSPEELLFQQTQIQTLMDFIDTWNPTLLPSILYPTPLLCGIMEQQLLPQQLPPLLPPPIHERIGYPSEAYGITKSYKNMLLRIRGVEAMLVARYGSKTPLYNYQMTNEDYDDSLEPRMRQVIWYRRRYRHGESIGTYYYQMMMRWIQVFGGKDLLCVMVRVLGEVLMSIGSYCWYKFCPPNER